MLAQHVGSAGSEIGSALRHRPSGWIVHTAALLNGRARRYEAWLAGGLREPEHREYRIGRFDVGGISEAAGIQAFSQNISAPLRRYRWTHVYADDGLLLQASPRLTLQRCNRFTRHESKLGTIRTLHTRARDFLKDSMRLATSGPISQTGRSSIRPISEPRSANSRKRLARGPVYRVMSSHAVWAPRTRRSMFEVMAVRLTSRVRKRARPSW
jgi:hypothetical protein